MRVNLMQEIANSEARTRQALAALPAPQARGDDRFDIVDFKAIAPSAFHGKREESWKQWSRKFKTYCNARREGFRAALNWAEAAQMEINGQSIGQMQWQHSVAADSKLYDFLLLITLGDALIIVEHYEGQGFEAWRQLCKRFNPSGGQFELDMMTALMNPTRASSLQALPGAVDRFERDLRTYEAKTGRAFPAEWKIPIFMKVVPESHKKEIHHIPGLRHACGQHPPIQPRSLASRQGRGRHAGRRARQGAGGI